MLVDADKFRPAKIAVEPAPGEKALVEWKPADLGAQQVLLPQYVIHGPEKRAICSDESGLFGAKSRLLSSTRNVQSMRQATLICDHTPGCTHWSWNAGPEMFLPAGFRPTGGSEPYRLDICRGSMVSIVDDKFMNTFVGVRRDLEFPEQFDGTKEPSIPEPASLEDGPLPRGQYIRSARSLTYPCLLLLRDWRGLQQVPRRSDMSSQKRNFI